MFIARTMTTDPTSADIGPAHRHLGAHLRAALEGIEPSDERFEEDINSALGLLTI
jgi:hypothetical protein